MITKITNFVKTNLPILPVTSEKSDSDLEQSTNSSKSSKNVSKESQGSLQKSEHNSKILQINLTNSQVNLTNSQLNLTNSQLSPIIVERDPIVRNILLIGASQNGKSALGNFLVTGKAMDNSPVFRIGNGTASCSTNWTSKPTEWKYRYLPPEVLKQRQIYVDCDEATKHEKQTLCKFQIIDTPGTGDVNVNNEETNMKLLYNSLKIMKDKQEKLALALLVVKYASFLNEELKANIIYYKKMLPEIMNANVYLIITNVENNETWINKQLKGGKPHPKSIIEKIQQEIQNWLETSSEVPMFTIDSMFDPESLEEQNAIKIRELLFATCVTTPSITLNGMRFPKTKQQLEKNKREIEKFEGQKDGINKGIALIESNLKNTADKIAALSVAKEYTASKLTQLKEEYEAKNVDELVIIKS